LPPPPGLHTCSMPRKLWLRPARCAVRQITRSFAGACSSGRAAGGRPTSAQRSRCPAVHGGAPGASCGQLCRAHLGLLPEAEGPCQSRRRFYHLRPPETCGTTGGAVSWHGGRRMGPPGFHCRWNAARRTCSGCSGAQHLLGHQYAFFGGGEKLLHAEDRLRLRHGSGAGTFQAPRTDSPGFRRAAAPCLMITASASRSRMGRASRHEHQRSRSQFGWIVLVLSDRRPDAALKKAARLQNR